jgi:two-component system KDP operon response regulator KdpE
MGGGLNHPLMPSSTPITLLLQSSAPVGGWMERLRREGYNCAGPHHPAEALVALRAVSPIVVLITCADGDGPCLHLIREVRRNFFGPIIAVSARARPNAEIDCLEAGACDYLVEPLDADELVARIRSRIRRHDRDLTARKAIKSRGLNIDFDAQHVMFMEHTIDLTRTEYKILALLAESEGRPIPYAIFFRELWGENNAHAIQYLRISILNIRKKILAAGIKECQIVTRPKYGYALDIDK